jgi:hypothetical protein
MTKKSIILIWLFLLISTSSWGAKFQITNESFTADATAPTDPWAFDAGSPPANVTSYIRQSTNGSIGKYYELAFNAPSINSAWLIIDNPAGNWGALTTTHTVAADTWYYFATFVRVDNVGTSPRSTVWGSNYSANKGLVIDGTGVRAGIGLGYWQWGYYVANKYSFIAKVNYGVEGVNYNDGTYKPNQNGYSETNNYPMDYGKWYGIVAAYKFSNTATGAVRYWVNGTLVVSYDNVVTSNSASPTMDYIEFGATQCQNAYDCPTHKENLDGIIITTDWADIVAGGYLTDVEGTDSTPPTMSTAVISTNGVTLTLGYSESVNQGAGYNDSDIDVDCATAGNNIAVTYSSGNGTATHVYTLASPVLSGDTCNIDFNGDANSIEDGAGNDLAAIVSGAVTNSSTQAYPTFSSAAIDTTGKILTVTFSENVRIGSGSYGGITVSSCSGGALTVSYTSNNGATVVYGQPSRTVEQGETGCVLGYTQPGNGIEQSSGNYLDVQTFSGQAITNNSTVTPVPSVPGATIGGGLSVGGGGRID